MDTSDKLKALRDLIAERGRLVIAYSGGVDSGLLAAVAAEVLGDRAVSVVLDSETMPRRELKHALDLAEDLGLNCLVARYPIEDGDYLHNPPERCYLCKKGSARVLKAVAADEGISCVADGVNLSDYGDYRPGIRAYDEEGIWHPFVDADVDKADIREMAREMGLHFWERPSSACLASRIHYGEEITAGRLCMIEEAEDLLKDLGFGQVRVRLHGDLARIEVPEAEMESVFRSRGLLVEGLKSMGFVYVTMDLEGFRSGSMNEAIGRDSLGGGPSNLKPNRLVGADG